MGERHRTKYVVVKRVHSTYQLTSNARAASSSTGRTLTNVPCASACNANASVHIGSGPAFCGCVFSHCKFSGQDEGKKQASNNKRTQNTRGKKKKFKYRVKGGIEPLGFTSSPTDLKSALQNHWRSFTLQQHTHVTLGAHNLRLCDHEQKRLDSKRGHQVEFTFGQEGNSTRKMRRMRTRVAIGGAPIGLRLGNESA